MATTTNRSQSRFAAWFLQDRGGRLAQHPGPMRKPGKAEDERPWWQVMCLTGVDYFSTLGYQPGIAALAAGVLSPLATLVLVALTLLGALPVYRRVAVESPHGGGSIAMLAEFLPRWTGKLVMLVLLGFAATDFIITITLSAADGAAHLIENPYVPAALHGHNLTVTLVLLVGLAAVFLKGFVEAVGIAFVLVGTYLALNMVVAVVGLYEVITARHLVVDWTHAMTMQHGNIAAMVGVALLVFPKLALGMSGFETGVAVMPQIRSGTQPARESSAESEERPIGRIRGARKLLATAAAIMSVFLVLTSFITVVLIPEPAFGANGPANGRALAYLAHAYLGNGFGTAYDISTIAILWFAGASAMAGLLNLVPRYLPRFGMAPEWARAVRPLVVVFAIISFVITWYFDAGVDAQGAAYATGVLVLITSAAVAVAISAVHKSQHRSAIAFTMVSAVFVYTTVANVFERPEGVQLAGLFIVAILSVSFISRFRRAFELRAIEVGFDADAIDMIDEAAEKGLIRIIATHGHRDPIRYRIKEAVQRDESHIPEGESVLFLEVIVKDASEFNTDLRVHALRLDCYQVLSVEAAAVPNSIAAILLAIRDRTGLIPHVYFEWTEGNPLAQLLKFLFFGEGEVAPVAREVIRRAVPDRSQRPHVHVDS